MALFNQTKRIFNASFTPTPGCWLWTGNKSSKGYARISIGHKEWRASRVSYEMHVGPIPEDLLVRHKCDNPLCVNPDHLELGTPQDNMDDKVSRGRHSHGENHKRSKVTEQDVREMRELPSYKLPLRVIAEMYGISISTAGRIINRQIWTHVR